MWVEFVLGLLVTIGVLVVLIVGCRLQPSPLGRGSWWGARLSERREAEGRSQALLRELLSEQQYHQLLTSGYLEVPSSSREDRVYRIPSTVGMVTVYEHGRAIMRLCLQSTEPLPRADVVVMHKAADRSQRARVPPQGQSAPRTNPNGDGGLLTFSHV